MGKSKTSNEIKEIYKIPYRENFRPEYIVVNGHKILMEEYLKSPKKYNKLKPTKEALKQMKEYNID